MHSQAKNEAKNIFNFSSKFAPPIIAADLFILARKSRALVKLRFVFLIEQTKAIPFFSAFAKKFKYTHASSQTSKIRKRKSLYKIKLVEKCN